MGGFEKERAVRDEEGEVAVSRSCRASGAVVRSCDFLLSVGNAKEGLK